MKHCTGKVGFDSMTLAQIAAKRSRRSHEAVVRAYRCFCGKVHLGSEVFTRKRPLREFGGYE